jgi:hypothetical protein
VAEQSAGGRLRLGELGRDRQTGVAPEALGGAVLGPDGSDVAREGLAIDALDGSAQPPCGDPAASVGQDRRAGGLEQAPPGGHTGGRGRAAHEARALVAPDPGLANRAGAQALLLLGPRALALRLADVRGYRHSDRDESDKRHHHADLGGRREAPPDPPR